MIKAILLDWGGVLSQSKTVEVLKEYEDKFGKKAEDVKRLMMTSFNSYSTQRGEKSYSDFKKGAAKLLNVDYDLMEEIWREIDIRRVLDQEVLDIVRELKQKYVIVLFSDNIKERFWKFMDKFELRKEFDYIFCSANIGVMKDDEKAFNIVLREIKLKPEECVFVDDRKVNIDVAKKLGCTTVHFQNPEQLRQRLIEQGVAIR